MYYESDEREPVGNRLETLAEYESSHEPSRPSLTANGRRFAETVAASSIVARVALAGYGAGWPDTYVATAVRTCNGSAEPDEPEVWTDAMLAMQRFADNR